MRKNARIASDLLHHAAARKSAPPESTGAEAGYLVQAMESKGTLAVRLLDGSDLRGVVEGYDRDCIVLRVGGKSMMLRKAKVKYYWLDRG